MTREEAKKVAAVAATADGGFPMGCPNCAEGLFTRLKREFPEVQWENLLIEAVPDEVDAIQKMFASIDKFFAQEKEWKDSHAE